MAPVFLLWKENTFSYTFHDLNHIENSLIDKGKNQYCLEINRF